MTYLVFSGVFDFYLDVKFIIYYCGVMVFFFLECIAGCYDYVEVFFKIKYIR